jgi:hypothetical protein
VYMGQACTREECLRASYSWTRRSLLRYVSGFQHMTRTFLQSKYRTGSVPIAGCYLRAHAAATVEAERESLWSTMPHHPQYEASRNVLLWSRSDFGE